MLWLGSTKPPPVFYGLDTELSPQHRVPLIKFGRLGLSSMTGRQDADTSDGYFYHYKRCGRKPVARQDVSQPLFLNNTNPNDYLSLQSFMRVHEMLLESFGLSLTTRPGAAHCLLSNYVRRLTTDGAVLSRPLEEGRVRGALFVQVNTS